MNSDINSPLLVESTIPPLRDNVPTEAQYIFGVTVMAQYPAQFCQSW